MPQPWDEKGQGQFGPFSDVLTQPFHPQSGIQPTGWETKGPQIANYANQFLEGMSKARRQKFEQGELQQQRLYQNINQAWERLRDSNLTPEAKAAAEGKLEALQLGILAKHVDSGTGKGGKGEQGPGHQALGAIKGVLDAVVGPRPKKYDVGPEQVYSALHDVYSSMSDPKNSVQSALDDVGRKFQERHSQLGANPTYDQVTKDPVLNELTTRASHLTGGKRELMPAQIQNIMGSLRTPEEEGKLKESASATSAHQATAGLAEQRTKQERFENLRTSTGQIVRRDTVTGDHYIGDQKLDQDDPAIRDAHTEREWEQAAIQQLISDRQIKIADIRARATNENYRIQASGRSAVEAARGRTAQSIASLKSQVDSTTKEMKDYADIYRNAKLGPKERQSAKDKMEEAQRRLNDLQEKVDYNRELNNQLSSPQTATPPGPKIEVGTPSNKAVDDLLNNIFAPPKTNTGATAGGQY
jgi:hypothetical protein